MDQVIEQVVETKEEIVELSLLNWRSRWRRWGRCGNWSRLRKTKRGASAPLFVLLAANPKTLCGRPPST